LTPSPPNPFQRTGQAETQHQLLSPSQALNYSGGHPPLSLSISLRAGRCWGKAVQVYDPLVASLSILEKK
jgi:hypothetical protein